MTSRGNTPRGRAGAVVALCIICLLASAIAVRAAATLITGGAAQVGTLIRFAPTGQPGSLRVAVPAHRLADADAAARSCTLSIRVIKAYGGSLMVEARNRRTARVLAHWAGTRTASGPADCGRTAQLVLRTGDLQALIAAASGLGPAAAALASPPAGT